MDGVDSLLVESTEQVEEEAVGEGGHHLLSILLPGVGTGEPGLHKGRGMRALNQGTEERGIRLHHNHSPSLPLPPSPPLLPSP